MQSKYASVLGKAKHWNCAVKSQAMTATSAWCQILKTLREKPE